VHPSLGDIDRALAKLPPDDRPFRVLLIAWLVLPTAALLIGTQSAEIGLARAIADAKARALALPAALFATAFIVALAAVTAFAVGVVMTLAKFIGPLAAGFIGMLIFAAIAGGLGWYGAERLRRDL